MPGDSQVRQLHHDDQDSPGQSVVIQANTNVYIILVIGFRIHDGFILVIKTRIIFFKKYGHGRVCVLLKLYSKNLTMLKNKILIIYNIEREN